MSYAVGGGALSGYLGGTLRTWKNTGVRNIEEGQYCDIRRTLIHGAT